MNRSLPILISSIALAACASLSNIAGIGSDRLTLPRLSFEADTQRTRQLAPGAAYHFVYSRTGPWAIHVLDVDRIQCWTPVAVKGAPGAIGRSKTSDIVRDFAQRQPVSRPVAGGVNADFFLFAPPGLPTGPHVSYSRVVTGPGERPMFALDSSRALRIGRLRLEGSVRIDGETHRIDAWNKPSRQGLALYDDAFGARTDSGRGRVEVRLAGRDPMAVEMVDTLPDGIAIVAKGHVLVAGPEAPASLRARLLSLRAGDTLRASVALEPFHPMEAVGGFPILVRDSAIADAVETAGAASFRGRHPRTAVGVAQNGRRLFLVVVDGRQQPYSDGMTLRELASLMRDLGATQALNLDGGGSTTLVYADPDSSGSVRVANRPSDRTGERPVGNALAVVKECS